MKHGLSQTIRRSVALPRRLVAEAANVAPAEAKSNFNRLVTIALRDYAAAHRARTFEQTMADMAADPAIRAESTAIQQEYRATESDGLQKPRRKK